MVSTFEMEGGPLKRYYQAQNPTSSAGKSYFSFFIPREFNQQSLGDMYIYVPRRNLPATVRQLLGVPYNRGIPYAAPFDGHLSRGKLRFVPLPDWIPVGNLTNKITL
jgi:hypothetical protein